jgi:hypothetical protein
MVATGWRLRMPWELQVEAEVVRGGGRKRERDTEED